MTVPAHDVLTDACAEARTRFLARVPEPRPEAFPCRWCGAPVGRPCTRLDGRSGPHRPRGDRWRRAHDAWWIAAESACDNAVNTLCELAKALAS
ncbi:zinc finger domain-containing protein [Streptomyces sp. NPDC001537]